MTVDELTITRWRLIDAIEGAPPGALILVVAGAGYGKSTLLHQWAARSGRACAVVQASADQDADQLGLAIAQALVKVVPAAGEMLERAERSDAAWTVDLLPQLLELASEQVVALAIDDVHVLASPSSTELLSVMARAWPAPSTLILSGRERPPVPLMRDHVAAPVVVIGEPDLDFDPSELEELDGRFGVGGPGERQGSVLELTGGWPAGIRLAALLRGTDLRSTEGTVESFLTAEVLSEFTPHELDYLGHVALLAPAPARVVDLVLHRNDTLATLQALQARGLPMVVVPSDADEPIQVHALLSSVLEARLSRRDPQWVDTLVDLAVDEGQRARELTYVANLLERRGRREQLRAMPYLYMFPLVSTGATGELRRWLEPYPPEDLEEDPFLTLPYSNVLRPRDEEVVRRLFRRHEQDTTTVLPDGNSPALACRRMLTAFGLSPADPADVDLLGGWRQTSGVTRAWDLYSDDDLAGAEDVLLSLRNAAHKYPVTDAVGLAKLAIIALETGRSDEAAERAARAAHIVAEGRMEETALGFIVDSVGIKLARRLDRMAVAERLAADARRKMAIVGDGTMLERVTTLIELATLHLDLGYSSRLPRAMHREAAAILERWPSTVRLDRQLAQLEDRLGEASTSTDRAGGPSELLTDAELRVLHYLPSHLTLARVAEELFLAHSTVKSQTRSLYRKLGASSREEAVRAAVELGLLR